MTRNTLYKTLGLSLLSLALGASPAWADAHLPELGGSASQSLSAAQEAAVGEEAMQQIRQQGGVLDDPELEAYINQLGGRLVQAADSSIRFNFFVVPDHRINAFALPGGFVGVNTGLIATTQHESELAAVLAHEVSHVTQHHMARLLESQRAAPWVTLGALAVAVLASQGGGNAGVAATAASSAYLIQRQLSFTYAYEQEADRVGMQTLQASGLDPFAMPAFFARMQPDNNAPEFLRTHPVSYKRISDTEARLLATPFKLVADSADYRFMRERAIVLQADDASAMVTRYQGMLAARRYGNLAAHLYGLAVAQHRVGDESGAWQSLQQARTATGGESHAVLEYLAGDIQLAQQHIDQALALFRQGQRAFPAYHPLVYGEINALISAQRYAEALQVAEAAQGVYPSDPQWYALQARIYAGQRNGLRQHLAQAEFMAQQHDYAAAVEQLRLAQKLATQDFYQASRIDARIKELQALIPDVKDKVFG